MPEWQTIDQDTDLGDFPGRLTINQGLLRSRFAAGSFPANPSVGQPCVRTDRGWAVYTYTGDVEQGEGGWVEEAALSLVFAALKAEVQAARFDASSLGAYLATEHNSDGSHKTGLGRSDWIEEADEIARVSGTQLTIAGDKTAMAALGRAVELNDSAHGFVSAASYDGGPGLTTVTAEGCAVPDPLSKLEWGPHPATAPSLLAGFKAPLIQSGDGLKLLRANSGGTAFELVTGTTLFREARPSGVTIHVNPSTGNDTTGTGAAGAPFATIGRAVTEAYKYESAAYNAFVIISLSNGLHTVASTITLNANAPRQLLIQGTTLNVSVTGIQSCTGSSGAWTVVVNCADVTGVEVGDIFGVGYSVAGGSYPQALLGAHRVSAVDAGNNRLTLDVKTRTSNAVSGAVTVTGQVYKARITNGGAGHSIFQVLRGANLLLANVAFNNQTTTGNPCIQVGQGGSVICTGGASAWGCNCLVQVNSGGYFYGCNYIGNCQYGYISSGAGSLETYYSAISGCDVGIYLMYGTQAYIMAPYIAGCGSGIAADYGPCMAYAGGGLIYWCPTYGISATAGAHISAFSVTITGCGTGNYAYAHGFINANGATSGNTTNFSPAANTHGNEDSYINT